MNIFLILLHAIKRLGIQYVLIREKRFLLYLTHVNKMTCDENI